MTQLISLLRRLEAQVERTVAAFEAADTPTDYAGIDRAAKAISSLTRAAVQVDAAIHEAQERAEGEPEKSPEPRRESIDRELRAIAAECGLDLGEWDKLEASLDRASGDHAPAPGPRIRHL